MQDSKTSKNAVNSAGKEQHAPSCWKGVKEMVTFNSHRNSHASLSREHEFCYVLIEP